VRSPFCCNGGSGAHRTGLLAATFRSVVDVAWRRRSDELWGGDLLRGDRGGVKHEQRPKIWREIEREGGHRSSPLSRGGGGFPLVAVRYEELEGGFGLYSRPAGGARGRGAVPGMSDAQRRQDVGAAR
jgi:hypothetical protein